MTNINERNKNLRVAFKEFAYAMKWLNEDAPLLAEAEDRSHLGFSEPHGREYLTYLLVLTDQYLELRPEDHNGMERIAALALVLIEQLEHWYYLG